MKNSSVQEKSSPTELQVFNDIRLDPELTSYIQLADEHMGVIGYTEHGARHGLRVANWAGQILAELGYSQEDSELARIAGYLHDMGNFICRTNHGQTAAALLYPILNRFQLSVRQIGLVLSAIGNHEEQYGQVFNSVCAAVVIADKSDVHRSRVRAYDPNRGDIHDNVNYAVTDSQLSVDAEAQLISLALQIDTQIASVMDYFEIFLDRMVMCRSAATFLGCRFHIVANGTLIG